MTGCTRRCTGARLALGSLSGAEQTRLALSASCRPWSYQTSIARRASVMGLLHISLPAASLLRIALVKRAGSISGPDGECGPRAFGAGEADGPSLGSEAAKSDSLGVWVRRRILTAGHTR